MREARISIVNSRKANAAHEDMDTVLERAEQRINLVSRSRPDLILLSEIFANYPAGSTAEDYGKSAQELDGSVCEKMSGLARKYGSYIAFGLLRKDRDRVFNSLVLVDRQGQPAWTYDKTTPVIMEMEPAGVTPGKPDFYDCDFGRVAGAICFDINFGEIAESYLRNNVELLLFSSAFPAGKLLDAWSIRYGFSIAGSTWYEENRIIDSMGLTYARTSDIIPYTTAVLNLNRRVVHMDDNLERIQQMVNKYAGDVIVEDHRDEAVVVLRSLRKGLEIADVIEEFQIELLHEYMDRSRAVRAAHGGL